MNHLKRSVYLDSTIPSYLYDQRAELRVFVDLTRQWWNDRRDAYAVWVSEETLAEVLAGEYPNKESVVAAVTQVPVLPFDERIVDIARVYCDHHLMPQSEAGDAFHLAYASFYRLDFLLTWNCNHLANANKQEHIRIINTRLGLFTPVVTTPLQLMGDPEHDA